MTIADIWTVLPLLLIAAGAIVVLICGAVAPGRHLAWIGVAVLVAAAFCAVQPFPASGPLRLGVAFTPFARFFTVLFSLTAAATLMLSGRYNEEHGIHGEEYPATVLFAAFGMATLAGATNFIVFFLALEALTFAFYILVAMELERSASGEAGLKYLLQGAVAAACIVFGIALIYAGSGSLSLASALRGVAEGGAKAPLLLAGWGFIVAGMAFKVSLVPAHLWTPDVYEGAPPPVVAFLGSGSKGASMAAFLLLATALGGGTAFRTPLWWLSLLSMVLGNLAALLQPSLRRMLAYSAIAQMGYVTLALLTATPAGFRGVVFYVVVYTLMNLMAFGAITALSRPTGLETVDDCRGIGYSRPFPAAMLALAMFALAGIPPTAGFTGKFFIFYAALQAGELPLAVIGILSAAASVYYYLRVVVNLYMRAANETTGEGNDPGESIVLGWCGIILIVLGIYPGPLLTLIDRVIP